MRRCIVAECDNNDGKLLCHRFPRKAKMLEKWKKSLNLDHFPDTELLQNFVVCTAHFLASDYRNRISNFLNITAVPQIQGGNPRMKQTKTGQQNSVDTQVVSDCVVGQQEKTQEPENVPATEETKASVQMDTATIYSTKVPPENRSFFKLVLANVDPVKETLPEADIEVSPATKAVREMINLSEMSDSTQENKRCRVSTTTCNTSNLLKIIDSVLGPNNLIFHSLGKNFETVVNNSICPETDAEISKEIIVEFADSENTNEIIMEASPDPIIDRKFEDFSCQVSQDDLEQSEEDQYGHLSRFDLIQLLKSSKKEVADLKIKLEEFQNAQATLMQGMEAFSSLFKKS